MRMAEELVRPQLVLFGDSITEQSFVSGGWGAALAHTFSRKADVLLRGYGGYNTRWALFLLNRLFPLNGASVPSATIIFFGSIDASLMGGSSEKQHVPLDEYKDNLNKIITHLKETSPSMTIVLVTPPPIHEDRKLQERTNEMTGRYARKCAELAIEMHLPCVDLWSIMQESHDWQNLFLSDGLQLTTQGNELVHKELVRALAGIGLHAEDMPLDFPHHSQIDGAYPQRAFHQDCHVDPTDSHANTFFAQDVHSGLEDLDYYDDETLMVEMVDPTDPQDEFPQVGPAFESLLVPLPHDAFFPITPSPTQNHIKTELFYLTSTTTNSSSSPLPILDHVKKEPCQENRVAVTVPAPPPLYTGTKKTRRVRKSKGKKKCSHCEATRTPQWRIGPMGPGTLCNACGVVYCKVGRLSREYRPIGSPAFVPSIHTNKQKEIVKTRQQNREGLRWDWVESSS